MLNNHDGRAKCDKYRVYLLENEDDRAGKLVLDAKESGFTVMLTASDQKKYPLMEFVSPCGKKTVALSDVSDELLTIVLERKMILKKPAIYLYPSQAMQVSVTHRFKGKILNTYPVYLILPLFFFIVSACSSVEGAAEVDQAELLSFFPNTPGFTWWYEDHNGEVQCVTLTNFVRNAAKNKR